MIERLSRCFFPEQQPIRGLAWKEISNIRAVRTDEDTAGSIVAQGGKEDALGAFSGGKGMGEERERV
jgi:hypothetical protein